MTELRSSERIRCLLRAQIVFNNRMSTIDCTIKNISAAGAKLALPDTLSIPEEFDLFIPQKGRTFRARMTWRDTNSLGVEFKDAIAVGPLHEDKDEKLRELERINAELRKRVQALSKRLQDLGQDPDLAA